MRVRESDPLAKIERMMRPAAGDISKPAADLSSQETCPNCRRPVRPAAPMCWCGYRLQAAPAVR